MQAKFKVIFLTRQPTKTKVSLSTFLDKEDKDYVEFHNIVMQLPRPSLHGEQPGHQNNLNLTLI